ncbi:MAG: RNA polymerase sigma factor [Planctomycetia bacterium]|nr:RNA polymerase sigma factor [Planctomycetia bacterium]
MLVRRFQAHERTAFDQIDRRYRGRIERYLRGRLGSQDLAEELAQETLVKALTSLEQLENGAFLSSWLFRIAYRLLVDWTRRAGHVVERAQSYREATDSDSEHEAIPQPFSLPDGTCVESRSPDASMIEREQRDNLWFIAEEILTQNEFLVLWKKYVDQLRDEQIATELGKSKGAVRALATRARNKLKDVLIVRGVYDEAGG